MARDDVSKRANKRNENKRNENKRNDYKRNENKVDPSGKVEKPYKMNKMDNYQKAKLVYEQIQETRRVQREEKKKAQEKKQQAREQYNTQKKKMGKAIKRQNKKGQPNLGAQMEAILGKIEKRMN